MKLLPSDGDKIVLISPDGIEYPGTIEKRDSLFDSMSVIEYTYRIKSDLDHPQLWNDWRIRLEKEDVYFDDFAAFMTTDRSRRTNQEMIEAGGIPMASKVSSIIADMIQNRIESRELFNRRSMLGLGEPEPDNYSEKLKKDFIELQESLEKSLGAKMIARDILSGMDFGPLLGAWMTRAHENKSQTYLAYINAVMAFEVLVLKERDIGTYQFCRERIRDKMKKLAGIINLLEEKLDIG